MNLSVPSLISPVKLNRHHKNSRTETIFTASWAEQQRPEFTRKSITGNLTYQWKNKPNTKHKLALFNLSYVNFQGDATDLSNISEYLIAKDYSNHLNSNEFLHPQHQQPGSQQTQKSRVLSISHRIFGECIKRVGQHYKFKRT